MPQTAWERYKKKYPDAQKVSPPLPPKSIPNPKGKPEAMEKAQSTLAGLKKYGTQNQSRNPEEQALREKLKRSIMKK